MRSRAWIRRLNVFVLWFFLTAALAGCTGDEDATLRLGTDDQDAHVPYLQQGANAARTGATADPGPETFDLAFSVDLPGTRWREVVPVVMDQTVYLLTSGETTGIWRIDLTTGDHGLFVDLEDGGWTSTFFSDGSNLFVGQGNEILAFDVQDGTPVWEAPYRFPQVLAQPSRATNCMAGSFSMDLLYLGCTQVAALSYSPASEPVEMDGDNVWTETVIQAVALDATTGEEVWRTVLDPVRPEATFDPAYRPQRILVRTALGPERLYVEGVERAPAGYDVSPDGPPEAQMRQIIWAFGREQGELQWTWRAPPHTVGGGPNALFDPNRYVEARDRDLLSFLDMGLVATPNALYVKADRLHALDPETGDGLWELPLYQSDDSSRQGYALAFFDDDLYVTSHSHLYRVDAIAQSIEWSVRTAPGDDWDDTLGLLVANGAVYGVSDLGRLSVYDLEDGSIIHQRRIGPEQTTVDAYVVAVGEGVAVASRNDGEVLVFGRTPAAIQASVDPFDAYPGPGEQVSIDLSGTQAGALADDLEFQVNWGDGTLTDWQREPRFTHAYPRAQDQTATVRVRNSAGQEATETLVFHVGSEAPRPPTFLETAFARENQDLTFGVLGIAVAMAGGVIALGHRYSKRGRLQRELTKVERDYAEMKDDTNGCEAMLDASKIRARRLLVDGKLDEPQLAILERRLDELARGLRIATLDERFAFLPHGVVRALGHMLHDGRVDSWERAHVLRALDDDDVLTKRQKQKVRTQIDRWFEHDRGQEE